MTSASMLSTARPSLEWDSTEQNPDERERMDTIVSAAESAGAPRRCCATCAFRRGSEANQSALVLEMIEESRFNRGLFLCHSKGKSVEGGFVEIPEGEERECAGMIHLLLADYDAGRIQ